MKPINGRGGRLVLCAVILTPPIAFLFNLEPHSWADPARALNAAGRLTGIAGMTSLLVAAIISIRIPGLDRWFGGLTRLWNVHHLVGFGAFLALLAHPLLLAFAAAPVSPRAAASVLWPPMDALATWLGWVALILMMVFLAPTFSFFGAPHYQRWKRLHAISAFAIAAAFAHTVMLGRGLPAWSWWALATVAGAALVFRLGWRKVRPGDPFVVSQVEPLADRVVELSLRPERGAVFAFEPGQFVYFAPLDPALPAGRREEHPYTISSAPSESVLRIAVKDLGDASAALQHVTPGTRAFVDGPYGGFLGPRGTGGELWIGGGIGITPFVSRARAARDLDDVVLVYCANDPTRAYFLDELDRIAAATPGLRVIAHYHRDHGALDAAWLKSSCADAPARTWYACGPAPLLAITAGLRKHMGVPRARYRSEEFKFL